MGRSGAGSYSTSGGWRRYKLAAVAIAVENPNFSAAYDAIRSLCQQHPYSVPPRPTPARRACPVCTRGGGAHARAPARETRRARACESALRAWRGTSQAKGSRSASPSNANRRSHRRVGLARHVGARASSLCCECSNHVLDVQIRLWNLFNRIVVRIGSFSNTCRGIVRLLLRYPNRESLATTRQCCRRALPRRSAARRRVFPVPALCARAADGACRTPLRDDGQA